MGVEIEMRLRLAEGGVWPIEDCKHVYAFVVEKRKAKRELHKCYVNWTSD